MKRIGIVVVTFNRLQYLKKYVQCINDLIIPEGYEKKTYIINNASTDGTLEWLNTIDAQDYEIINLKENTGGSGGFYTGIKYATEDNCDYVWGMDDDAFPEEQSLFNLLKCKEKMGDNYCYWSNCDKDKDFIDEFKEVKRWMFVGFFIPAKIVKEIGYPRKDFFIFFDDAEYSDRIQKYGHKILKVRDSIINHRDASSAFLSKKVMGKTIHLPDLPDWKRYYFIRNYLLRYKISEKRYWHILLNEDLKVLVKILFICPNQFGIGLKAYWHGIIRKSGKVIAP